MQAVSVIIPTQARAERAAVLRRALDSVLAQEGVEVVPLVVINGPEADGAVISSLCSDNRLRVVRLEQADLPAALRHGRTLVETPWFSQLDDDDLLLPGALATRLAAFEEASGLEAVVTNGIVRHAGGDQVLIPDASVVRRDPLRAMLLHNWLLPGSYLCRTAAIRPEIFDGMPRYLECTYLALRLATTYRMTFLEQPTVVWHTTTPDSTSRSRACVIGRVEALERILQLELPADVREAYRLRMCAACHSVAGQYWKEGTLDEAWRWHLESLRQPGGWRYLSFTRWLMYAWWKA